MPCRRPICVCLKSIGTAAAALLWIAQLAAQDRVESCRFLDQLIHSPSVHVNMKDDIDAPGARKGSAQRLANSWNAFVIRFRANEPRFSNTEIDALTTMLMHIQGGLSLIGLRPAGDETIPNSWQDLDQLLSRTSDLCTLLELKRKENPRVRELKKLAMTARVLDEEARMQTPSVPASQLHKHGVSPGGSPAAQKRRPHILKDEL